MRKTYKKWLNFSTILNTRDRQTDDDFAPYIYQRVRETIFCGQINEWILKLNGNMNTPDACKNYFERWATW